MRPRAASASTRRRRRHHRRRPLLLLSAKLLPSVDCDLGVTGRPVTLQSRARPSIWIGQSALSYVTGFGREGKNGASLAEAPLLRYGGEATEERLVLRLKRKKGLLRGHGNDDVVREVLRLSCGDTMQVLAV